MSASTVNTLIDAGNTALAAGNHATAILKFRQALAVLSSMPDSRKDNTEMEWDRSSLRQLILDLEKEKTASSISTNGLSTSKQNYINPTT